jgi:hypothetical protein
MIKVFNGKRIKIDEISKKDLKIVNAHPDSSRAAIAEGRHTCHPNLLRNFF